MAGEVLDEPHTGELWAAERETNGRCGRPGDWIVSEGRQDHISVTKRPALKSARGNRWREPSGGRPRGACGDRVSGRDVPGLEDEGGGWKGGIQNDSGV